MSNTSKKTYMNQQRYVPMKTDVYNFNHVKLHVIHKSVSICLCRMNYIDLFSYVLQRVAVCFNHVKLHVTPKSVSICLCLCQCIHL